jgi:hypothetical protein
MVNCIVIFTVFNDWGATSFTISFYLNWSWESSVGTETAYRLDGRGIGLRFAAGARDLCRLDAETLPASYPASYPADPED